MGSKFTSVVIAVAIALNACASVVQQGGNQGRFSRRGDPSIGGINNAISSYLNGDEVRSVLTPGEFNEWTLKLKAGQVVFGEAGSEAFDPAIEIADDKGKVLAKNDDRYPGDQRPLIMWRCEADGTYSVRVRCFHDKSGGAFWVRIKTYDSVDLSSGQKVEQEIDATTPFLFRVPMKAGQIKQIQTEFGGNQRYLNFGFGQVISPSGLPEETPSLAARLNPAIQALVAPVSGDYYVLSTPYGQQNTRGKVHAWMREIVPVKLEKQGDTFTAKAPTNVPAVWELDVKAGDFLKATTPELAITCQLTIANEPDFSSYDVSKPEANPFYPHPEVHDDPAFDQLPARAGDERITIFRAKRDAKLWLSTDAGGPTKEFTLKIGPGAADYAADRTNTGELRIADTNYWAFDAKAGDVMTLDTKATKFAEVVVVRDPDLREIRHAEMALDQTSDAWRMIVQKPGRYYVSVSSRGNGGSGDYTLTRNVLHAKEFTRTMPAKGEISGGQIQIWTFKAMPNDPLFIHWNSTNWDYEVNVYDEKGNRSGFERTRIDDHNSFGILKVDEPRTYVIVLTGNGAKSDYSIDLGAIPGYKPEPPPKK